MSYKFGNGSKKNLGTVDIKLQEVCQHAIFISPIDFGITEGLRSKERAIQLLEEGKSKLGDKSKHCLGLAVDIVCYDEQHKITWEIPYYEEVATCFDIARKKVGVDMRWGGNWKVNQFKLDPNNKFVDAVHFELV